MLPLLFTACTLRKAIDNKIISCTSTGTSMGSMLWNVNGADTKPSSVWTYNEKSVFDEYYYGPQDLVTCGDVVYVGGDRLTAIDIKTGKSLWETQIKNLQPDEDEITSVINPVVYGDKIVAIGVRKVVEKGFDVYFERCNICVFDKLTGKLLWKSVDIGSKNDLFIWGYPVVLNNKIYVPALNGEYRASRPVSRYRVEANEKEERGIWVWDLNTGKLLKKIFFSFKGGFLSPSATQIRSYGTNLYITVGLTDGEGKSGEGGSLYLIAYDTIRSRILWQTLVTDRMAMAGGINSFGVNSKVVAVFQPTVPTNNHGSSNDVKVFDRETGKLLWSKDITSAAQDFSLTEDKLFVQLTSNDFVCINPVTGKEIWTYKCDKIERLIDVPIFVPYATKNVLYIKNGLFIVALDLENGKEIWHFKPFANLFKGRTYGDWYMMPVDKGFVTLVAYSWIDGPMVSPPIVQFWSSSNEKK